MTKDLKNWLRVVNFSAFAALLLVSSFAINHQLKRQLTTASVFSKALTVKRYSLSGGVAYVMTGGSLFLQQAGWRR